MARSGGGPGGWSCGVSGPGGVAGGLLRCTTRRLRGAGLPRRGAVSSAPAGPSRQSRREAPRALRCLRGAVRSFPCEVRSFPCERSFPCGERPSAREKRLSLPEERPSPPEERPSPPEERPSPPEERPSLPEKRPSAREERPSRSSLRRWAVPSRRGLSPRWARPSRCSFLASAGLPREGPVPRLGRGYGGLAPRLEDSARGFVLCGRCPAEASLSRAASGRPPRDFLPRSTGHSMRSAARKASCGISTRPSFFMRFLPAFCFSSSFFLRVTSPP